MTHKVWRQGLRVAEVPIIFTDRFQGRSKMSGKIVEEALAMVWRLWAQNGFQRKPHPTERDLSLIPQAGEFLGLPSRNPLRRVYCAGSQGSLWKRRNIR